MKASYDLLKCGCSL